TTTTTKKTTTIIKPTTFKQKEIIDISQWNVVTDYAAAAKEIDGVILRCGIRGYGSAGNLAKDDSLETHYNGFKGKTKIGYYFFTQAKTTAEAEAEATYVVNTLLKGKTNNFPIFWDSELSGASGNTGRADGLSKTTRTNCAVAFIKKIKALGYKAGVYASESWFRDNLDLKKLTDAGAYIWVAKYSSSSPSTSSYDAWQYTSSGSVKGINGNVDKSHVYKNIAGW
ncbi:glycoside hydrolase, partial [Piromyces finnis]